jgi:hypothetical protein
MPRMVTHWPGRAPVRFRAAIGGDTGAENGGQGIGVGIIGQAAHKGRRGHQILGVAAGLGVARGLCRLADGLHACEAELAGAAGGIHPRHADVVAHSETADAGTQLGNAARHLVAGDQGNDRRWCPVAIHGVKIAVADAAGCDLDEEVPMAGLGHGNVLDFQRGLQRMQDSGFHCGGHGQVLPCWLLFNPDAAIAAISPKR